MASLPTCHSWLDMCDFTVPAGVVSLHLHTEDEARELRVEPGDDGTRIIFKLLCGFSGSLHRLEVIGRPLNR